MHPYRRQIVFRWVLALVLLLAALGWVATDTGSTLLREPPRSRPKQKKLPLPSEQEMHSLRSTVEAISGAHRSILADTGERPVRGLMVDKPKPHLAAKADTDKAEDSHNVILSLIMISGTGRFAVLNGIAYEEGNLLPDGRRVMSIEPDGVVLVIEGQEERLVWAPPHEVALAKAGQDQADDTTKTPSDAESKAPESTAKQAQDAARIIGESVNQ